MHRARGRSYGSTAAPQLFRPPADARRLDRIDPLARNHSKPCQEPQIRRSFFTINPQRPQFIAQNSPVFPPLSLTLSPVAVKIHSQTPGVYPDPLPHRLSTPLRFLTGALPISQHGLRVNEQVRVPQVRLINEANEQVGVIATLEAMRLAREAGMDLVEVSPHEKPPVCRLMDYGKWKYKQRKKEQKAHAGAHATQLKEIRLKSVRIDDHDQETKLKQAKGFLAEGHKVQFNLMFRGREMAHVNIGRDLMEFFKAQLEAVSKIEREPRLEGKRMIMIVAPKPHAPKEEKVAGAAPVAAAPVVAKAPGA